MRDGRCAGRDDRNTAAALADATDDGGRRYVPGGRGRGRRARQLGVHVETVQQGGAHRTPARRHRRRHCPPVDPRVVPLGRVQTRVAIVTAQHQQAAVQLYHVMSGPADRRRCVLLSTTKVYRGNAKRQKKNLKIPANPKITEYALNLFFLPLPATLHGGDGLPSVSPDVQSFTAGHAHGAVVAAHAVQHVVQSGHRAAAAPTAHCRHHRPLAHPRVVSLHGRLVIGRVEASQSVQTIVCGSAPKTTVRHYNHIS